MNLVYPIFSRKRITPNAIFLLFLTPMYLSCSSGPDPYYALNEGSINYPFYKIPEKIGHNGPFDKKLVIQSIAGNKKFVIELPNNGEDYNVEVPAAKFLPNDTYQKTGKLKNTQSTDRELVNQMPKINYENLNDRLRIEKGLGVGEVGGPRQSPSYINGLSEVSRHYRNREFEIGLVKVNNLLIHYPSSSKLLKMKGTLLIKMRNYSLAKKAWERAVELEPNDGLLKKGLARLNEKVTILSAKQNPNTTSEPTKQEP